MSAAENTTAAPNVEALLSTVDAARAAHVAECKAAHYAAQCKLNAGDTSYGGTFPGVRLTGEARREAEREVERAWRALVRARRGW